MFLTPCSTPQESDISDIEDLTIIDPLSQPHDYPINETELYNKLYDCYCLDLTDMQIMIGRAKDNWRYALNKGSSNLHILDRFSISLQIERRIVHTSDPLYPSLTLNANLPKLALHLNESKIQSARNLLHLIHSTGLPSPFKTSQQLVEFDPDTGQDPNTISEDTSFEVSHLLMMQFTVDQISLEIQSRGRSVAELQVSGVKMTFTKRSVDIGVTLTVHSLLLVDALQTFGADFELLVASHKHVGMDSMSGSLRDSEPTSPTSPASPDPTEKKGTTSPVALSQALSSLVASPPFRWPNAMRSVPVIDAEALIVIDIAIVTGREPMQIANLQFNNLDIIGMFIEDYNLSNWFSESL